MKRMIALLLLLCMLTACAAPVPETEEPTAASQEIAVPEQKQPDSGTMTGAATFTQAASEPLTYTVVLKTLEDSAAAADGTTLAVRSYELPEMTVTLPDGTVLTEAASPAETAALERAEAFNSRFRDWAGADGFDEVTAWAEEELAFRALWRSFYRTISIEGRFNPRSRMTHMPKRYWGTMTEFQDDAPARPLPPVSDS